MKYIKTKTNDFSYDDIDLISFNAILKEHEDELLSFGYDVNGLLFEVDLEDKKISVNGVEYELPAMPTIPHARWISFCRKQKTFPTMEVKIVGYGFGFQFELNGKNCKKLVFYDMEKTRLE
jgi:hypothetical protein